MSEYIVEIWYGDNKSNEPDEEIVLEERKPYIYEEDPYFHGKLGFRISKDTRPCELLIYTNDSVHKPTTNLDEWNGPVEHGLIYNDKQTYRPYRAEFWGRILILIRIDKEM